MFKKIISVFTVALLIITCFSACKKEEEPGEALACAISEMPATFDPQIASSTVERMIAVNIFDGLFKLDENNEPQKCAVIDYSISADGLVYTFQIQSDTYYYISSATKKFIESKNAAIEAKVTAEDFVFGITRAVLPETNAEYFELLKEIKNAEQVHNGTMSADSLGIRAIGEYTLEITLEKPSSDFLYALSQPVSYPCDKEFFDLTGGRYGLEQKYTITNGGFYLSNVSENKSVRIAKQSEYNGSHNAIPSAVGFYLNTDSVNIADKLDKGDYNVGFFTGEDAIDELGRRVQKRVLPNISCSLIFNMSDEKLQNISLRTGLISGVDLAKITEENTEKLVPAYYGDFGSVERILFNAENSHNTMIQAFDELKINNLSLDILCTPKYERIAKNIVNSWQSSIGVELNGSVTVLEEKDFNKRINSGAFQLAICSITVDSDKASDFLSVFTSHNSGNVFNYSSDEYNRLWNDMKNNPTNDNINLCQSYLLKNAVLLPIIEENTVFAMAKDTSGIYFSGDSANVYFYKGQKK